MTTRIEIAARAEDIAWMADTGESATGAARRLGISRGALEKFCRTHGLRTYYYRMADRDPRDHNTFKDNGRRTAA